MALGDCAESGDVDMVESCIARAEVQGRGLREWWSSKTEHVEVVWDVRSDAPAGVRPPRDCLDLRNMQTFHDKHCTIGVNSDTVPVSLTVRLHPEVLIGPPRIT